MKVIIEFLDGKRESRYLLMNFIPRAGEEITIRDNDEDAPCYYIVSEVDWSIIGSDLEDVVLRVNSIG